ncbi:hypothetical protein M758_4G195100 [Ceratodon purpureus]|uniref:Secreted protein n=1 Tax=Ceratodon purpureus TaxID=3225 RepID=A0A8T0IAC5_CERPU|nr:hypothetical protein KC19_4G191900 [Ceratodon purpureus]KAG0620170.1 hypothetical protein M758_4G195100 [Ceratodon purpureus]
MALQTVGFLSLLSVSGVMEPSRVSLEIEFNSPTRYLRGKRSSLQGEGFGCFFKPFFFGKARLVS